MTDHYIIQPGGRLTGRIRVPGDKSISHRAIMLGSLAEGETEVTGFLAGEDCLATSRAFQQMGVRIENIADDHLLIHGVGLHGLKSSQTALDLGNSGTSMRLLSGILSAQTFNTILTGDTSLRHRPMARIIKPLELMGAKIASKPGELPPLEVQGNPNLHGIEYSLPMASAQVKSALLLAGLYASGETAITEPAPTRDHTERMLRAFGYPIEEQNSTVTIKSGSELVGCKIYVPADISSAAFFMVGASIASGSDLLLKHVGINSSRIGVIHILNLMGANIEILHERMLGDEPVADIRIRAPESLMGIDIPFDLVPLAIDEFPAIFIAAACANGVTTLHNASELRVKESDRIAVMVEGLRALGIEAESLEDGIQIEGGNFNGGVVDSHGDHRVAMAFAMAGLRAKGTITIENCANVVTSFPNFVSLAQEAGLNISEE